MIVTLFFPPKKLFSCTLPVRETREITSRKEKSMSQFGFMEQLLLLSSLFTCVSTTQKFLVIFSFNSIGPSNLYSKKFSFTYPDTNSLRMNAQLFCYFFNGQPLFSHNIQSFIGTFVVYKTTSYNIIRCSIDCVNCFSTFSPYMNLTISFSLCSIVSDGINWLKMIAIDTLASVRVLRQDLEEVL